MSTTTSPGPKDLPEEFAAHLRSLQDGDSLLLNVFLAACRSQGWPTPALAKALGMNAPAVSKRVQRARRRESEAREVRQIRRGARAGAIAAGKQWSEQAGAVAEYERCRAIVAAYEIPEPRRVHAMLNGQQLDQATIDKLRQMQQQTCHLNGAVYSDDPVRDTSRDLAALLNHLITERGFSPYYLSKVMVVSPRAITSRLERHGFREPCPSVAGTPSGEYHGRRIGDPGAGAPRLDADQRERLRAAWQYCAETGLAAGLAALVDPLIKQGFTLANLAQAMSTRDSRVRTSGLRAALRVGRRKGAA